MVPVIAVPGTVNTTHHILAGPRVYSQVLELAVVLERVYDLRRAHFTTGCEGWLEDCPLWHRVGGRKDKTGRG